MKRYERDHLDEYFNYPAVCDRYAQRLISPEEHRRHLLWPMLFAKLGDNVKITVKPCLVPNKPGTVLRRTPHIRIL